MAGADTIWETPAQNAKKRKLIYSPKMIKE
jgi:hypothetical protein